MTEWLGKSFVFPGVARRGVRGLGGGGGGGGIGWERRRVEGDEEGKSGQLVGSTGSMECIKGKGALEWGRSGE